MTASLPFVPTSDAEHVYQRVQFPHSAVVSSDFEILTPALVYIALTNTCFSDRIVFTRVSVPVNECLARRRSNIQDTGKTGRRTVHHACSGVSNRLLQNVSDFNGYVTNSENKN